jgi:2-amino-4-hydroxy-6-hydroxymethyldihydropteridine diphosphokinase/dihydroneopterin aldolase/2-amino-4-hydroxy-6-hydroxymethyldihydropteridine diphosphokinase
MPGSKVTAYLALGSNMGDREDHLNKALELLGKAEGVEVLKVSAFLNTEPVGYTDQPDFLNAVVEVETTLDPYALLFLCNEIEQALKRKRIIHWGPRTIDVDILLFGDLVLEDEKLTIPHPRMLERDFVMRPLHEIAPKALHPLTKKTIAELILQARNQD